MKIVLASHGTRGDIEPAVVIGRELMHRGHDVQMAVPPNLVDFAKSVGLTAVAYGPEPHAFWDTETLRNFWSDFFKSLWKIGEPIRLVRELWEPIFRYWGEMSDTLTSLSRDADLLFTGQVFQELAVNVAEFCDIPLTTLHYFPMRPNGEFLPIPAPLASAAMRADDWFCWRMNKRAEDVQRRQFGLPRAKSTAAQRITERGVLELQAYDKICFPGLEAEWAEVSNVRPFIGGLSMEMPTEADDEVTSWIAAGTPPICFAFGSMDVPSPADTLEMISSACAQLGERALICSGWSNFSEVAHPDHVKVVGLVNYSAIFPICRAVVHHGGSGTTHACLRAGVPALILWTAGDQPFWGANLKRLKVGTGRRFLSTTRDSLVEDLSQILSPQCMTHARELATRMTKPAESVSRAADLMEAYAQSRPSMWTTP
ncbi:glycosyltransferase [Mycobacterium lehmannii]|uniref:glycosyltransferase n=1 Tax=Mycobacterium lehmannii TaxID=2048550 RepID=UPI000B93EE40|nr:glycosyltransferase [Mycobacterium lehmannii]